MEKNTKKELKIVLSPELHDELRFVFRPEVLENVIYKPEALSETKWQCCCGSVNELEVCPICGMEKNTVFSKVNAAYLGKHRKIRIAKKKKALEDQQALMAAQMLNRKRTKPQKTKEKNNGKAGIVVGILILCIALIISLIILLGGKDEPGKPIDTKDTAMTTDSPKLTDGPEATESSAPDTADAPESTSPETNSPETVPTETTPPETTLPETTAPVVPVELPAENYTGHVATVGDGKWPSGASGNVSVGGLVYTDSQYDYLAKDGITVLDKAGNTVTSLTSNKALGISGIGSNYIFYVDEGYAVHRINTTTKDDTLFDIKAKAICAYNDELYYIPYEGAGLYACNVYGDTTKIILKHLNVYALNTTADKLYFSTDESLAVISGDGSKVSTFCPDGAKATSIIEITECVFFTDTAGRLKFYNPALAATSGIEYPRYNVAITYVSAYENRVYIRTVDPTNGAVLWFFTRWTPGTQLFAPSAFASTGITTNSLYVTGSAVYDGAFTRFAVS